MKGFVAAKPAIRVTELINFIRKREAIRLARLAGKPPPWTKDWILQTYRFTNVRRKHDRVSQWLREYILNQCPPYGNRLPHFIALVTLCRFVNWPPTIAELEEENLIGEPIKWAKVGRLLENRHRRGDKTWTGAYMIKGHPKGKGRYIASVLGKSFTKHGEEIAAVARMNSCKAMHEALQVVDECGQFLAGQVVADLTYTPVLDAADDLYTWAPLGPGSRRGYNRLKGLPLKQWPDEDVFCKQLLNWRALIVAKLGKEYNDMTLMDVQNCLCEFDKYVRVKNDEGRPRSQYSPETAY